jgi:hypothetical protein
MGKKKPLKSGLYQIVLVLRFPSPNVKEGDFEGYYGTFGEGEGKSIFIFRFSL